jgi:hypothetical protein
MADRMDYRTALQQLHNAQIYAPAVVPGRAAGGWLVFSATREIARHSTMEGAVAAAVAASPPLPPRPLFLAEGYSVTRLGAVVATTSSKVMTQRIANALNAYNPNERGI